MTKEEKIAEAYGEHWETVKDYVNENGWCPAERYGEFITGLDNMEIGQKDVQSFKHPKATTFMIRPISLRGIETNNGWETIGTDKKIPGEDVWLLDKHGNMRVSEFGEFIPLNHHYTHYQPIIKPQKPIY